MRRNKIPSSYLTRLAEVPLFSACTPKELEHIASRAEEMEFVAGEVVIKEGWFPYDFFVIADGDAVVTIDGSTVAILGPGDFFGELALFDQATRNATVTAAGPLRAYMLGRRELYAAIDEAPGLTHKLLAGMARRVRLADARAYS